MSDRGWCETCSQGNYGHRDWCEAEQLSRERDDDLARENRELTERVEMLERALVLVAKDQLSALGWVECGRMIEI
jgi:hypothetical protein